MKKNHTDITLVCLNFTPEKLGIAPYTTRLAEYLTSTGHQVTVLTTFPHYPEWKFRDSHPTFLDEEVGGIRVRRFRHLLPRKKIGMGRALSEMSFGLKVVRYHRFRTDSLILVSPGLFSSLIVGGFIRIFRPKIKIAIWVQDIYSAGLAEIGRQGRFLRSVLKWLEGKVIRFGDIVVAIHENHKSFLTNELSVPENSIIVVRNWVHVSNFPEMNRKQFRQKFGWNNSDFVVLHAGNQGIKQNLEFIIEVARRCSESGALFKFVFLGGGSENLKLRKLSQDLGNVAFLEPVNEFDFKCFLLAADVLLLHENRNLHFTAVASKMTSYLASGTPILLSANPKGASAYDLQLSNSGIFVDPENIDTMLKSLSNLADQGFDRLQNARYAIAFSESTFSEVNALGKWQAVISNLVEN